MSDIVISVENLSKQYQLGMVGTGTLRHDLNRLWHSVRGKEDPYLKIGQANDRTKKAESDFVWALKDINFEVNQGEVLGIIGRNGAGKSTLLKILSKITAPTTGEIKVKGRIASLLEVGTGFHPELSGRENIFLNGAILGMRKWEVQKKFDEIVDFSGVEAYIDTPVKRYSSGMYVRLAFAVAAYLEPEILIVDEVLAVGDAEFQKKCLGRMKDVSKNHGRTVLFVSHNLQSVKELCNNCVQLSQGLFVDYGTSQQVVDNYLKSQIDFSDIAKDDDIEVLKFELCGEQPSHNLLVDLKFKFSKDNLPAFFCAFNIFNSNGSAVMQAIPTSERIFENNSTVSFEIQLNGLIPGMYFINFWAGVHNTFALKEIDSLLKFEIVYSPILGRTFPHYIDDGCVIAESKYKILS